MPHVFSNMGVVHRKVNYMKIPRGLSSLEISFFGKKNGTNCATIFVLRKFKKSFEDPVGPPNPYFIVKIINYKQY